MSEGIRLYCGLAEISWCTIPVPNYCGPWMTAPNLKGRVSPKHNSVIVDSGAFGDKERLSFAGALERQYDHEDKNKYTGSSFVAYDQLIDEKWDASGVRYKSRWSEDEAESAVTETIKANSFLSNVNLNGRRRVHPIQGVTAQQQKYCAEAVIPMIKNTGILGLGGWCIIGNAPPSSKPRISLESTFWDSMWSIIPMAAQHNIQHIHIFGVMVAPILGGLLWLCDEYDIPLLSTDSSGPHKRVAFGNWGYANWYKKIKKGTFASGRPLGEVRVAHVLMVKSWLQSFRETQYYKQPPKPLIG